MLHFADAFLFYSYTAQISSFNQKHPITHVYTPAHARFYIRYILADTHTDACTPHTYTDKHTHAHAHGHY